MANIDFSYFKKYLTKYDILLFDANYRIAHFRYNKLIQNGGSKNKNLLRKIKNHNRIMLRIFIESLLENNNQKIEYIVSQI